MNRLTPKSATPSATQPSSALAMDTLAVRLTAKEQETLEWIAVGKSAWEVAHILGKSEATVNFHLCNIRRKFEVTSVRSALIKAIDQGVIVLH